MTGAPATHRAREHQALLAAMARDGRRRGRALDRPWDPARQDPGEPADHGRGLLDAVALGLHVLWAYQQAWADEGFLATARLPESVRRLLELAGYRGAPALSASGLQHFRVRADAAPTTLPPGFRVRADPVAGTPAAVYETTSALRLTPELNELRPFLPAGPAAPDTTGAVAHAPELLEPQISVPAPEVAEAVALADELGNRFAVARAGSLAQRNAVRARQRALQLADLVGQLRDGGAQELCPEVFEQLCDDLCHTQQLANEAGYDPLPGPLSESQELLVTLLRGLSVRQPGAVAALGEALARAPGEPDAGWSRRLDRAAAFLDALVGGLLQEARDQVVRLRGPRALEAADRALAGPGGGPSFTRPGRRGGGVAGPGTDTLYLAVRAELLRPGDWLVLAEDTAADAPGSAAGNGAAAAPTRHYREAVRVVRVRTEVPPGAREPATRVTFTPPLTGRYRLDDTVLLGNVVEITHGSAVADTPRWSGAGAHLELAAGPLTWLRSADPDAVDGRVPQVSLAVAGRSWQRVDDLRGRAGTASFAVEVTPAGTSRLRLAGGAATAAVPEGTALRVDYRSGGGASGNRPALAVAALAGAEPAVATTFNPLPVTGGVDAEDADTARDRARVGTHAVTRAVSVADLRALALGFGGVHRVAVLRDAVRRRDHLTVVVAGAGGSALSDPDARRLHQYLLARTPPGTTITVSARAVVGVRMRLLLRVAPGHDPLAVLRQVRLALGADTDPGSTPGAGPGLLHPDRAELGRPVHLSDTYRCLTGLPHLASALVQLLHRDGEPAQRRDVIAVGPAELALWAPGEALDLIWEEAQDR